MNTQRSLPVVSRPPLSNALLEDLAAAWADARADTDDAYAAWSWSSTKDRPLAYAGYVAARDREAVAGDTYVRLLEAGERDIVQSACALTAGLYVSGAAPG